MKHHCFLRMWCPPAQLNPPFLRIVFDICCWLSHFLAYVSLMKFHARLAHLKPIFVAVAVAKFSARAAFILKLTKKKKDEKNVFAIILQSPSHISNGISYIPDEGTTIVNYNEIDMKLQRM